MCGIAGYAGSGNKKTLLTMLGAISHRGPDDQGIYIDKKVGLGNNRLSIIDLSSKGRQPIFDDTRSICIVFNGEIYNFQDLRKELESKYTFKTNTDTEVLLMSYKEWGIDCLQRLNGMFSFVIYDKNKDLLFGARDRLGEKPLKYYFNGESFIFASEIKGILPALKSKPEIDPIAINHYLTFGYVPAPLTGFKNIYKLPPGHFFHYKQGKLKIKKYWRLDFKNKINLPEKEWENILIKKLRESVKSRLIADVPVGVFLSGGIDSSALVALISQITKNKIKTFTVAFDDPKFDESKYASLITKLYNTDHKVLRVTSKMMAEIFTKLTNYYDEPFADNSIIPTVLLSKLASKHVKVALTGDGGDENFGGYERYNIVSFAGIYEKVPRLFRLYIGNLSKLANILIPTQFTNRLRRYTETFDQPFFRKYLQYSSFFDNETKFNLYTSAFLSKVKKSDSFSIFRRFYKKGSDLDNALNIDINTYLPEDLLFKTDIASMAYSLETRAPFLNHELLELTARMPHQLKVKLFNKKYIFKKILRNNNLVPDSIINRPKRGFVVPIGKWLKEDFKELLIEKLSSQKFKDSKIFDQVKLMNYLQEFFSGKVSANSIFVLLILALWVDEYF